MAENDPPKVDPPKEDPPKVDPPKTDPPGDPELGDAGKKAIAEERKARTAAEKALAEATKKLQEIDDQNKSELEKATEKAAQLEKDLAERDARLLRAEVAQSKGLTAAQAKRLSGSTKEELELDADELLESFPVKPATGDGDQGARGAQDDPDLGAMSVEDYRKATRG